MDKDFVSVADATREEMVALFETARRLKKRQSAPDEGQKLRGKTAALIFEKPSLRTRVTFETGMTQLGGHAIYLATLDIRMGKRESVGDVARNLSRWVDAIVARTFSHDTVVELASAASVPVINALSDHEHPCQALADYLTIWERYPRPEQLRISYVGDGNNVCHSLLLGAGILGLNLTVASPKAYAPKEPVVAQARALAGVSGGEITIVQDPSEGVADADVVYTDVFASMGQESEAEERARVFQPYQVNSKLLRNAASKAVVMHCLPAHRGEEITDEVLDGPQSIVLDQAENRLHAQNALLLKLMGGS